MRPGAALTGVILILAGLLQAASQARAGGDAVLVHHVRLAGWHGNNDALLTELLRDHAACAEGLAIRGRQAAPLGREALPALARPVSVEIYYASNRTLVASEGRVHYIDRDDCALRARHTRHLRLTSGAGDCQVDLIARRSAGLCDPFAHAVAQPRLPARLPSQAPDLAKLPPAAREKWAAHQSAQRPAVAQSERRIVADLECVVDRSPAGDVELCTATPAASRFAIPPSPLNGGKAGLLLESKGLLNLRAEGVRLNLKVASALFDVATDAQGNGGATR